MTQKQNDRARNQEFSRKREIYRGTDDDPPVLAITRDVVDANAWRAADIRAREAKLLGLMRDIWGIDVAGMQGGSRSDVAVSAAAGWRVARWRAPRLRRGHQPRSTACSSLAS